MGALRALQPDDALESYLALLALQALETLFALIAGLPDDTALTRGAG